MQMNSLLWAGIALFALSGCCNLITNNLQDTDATGPAYNSSGQDSQDTNGYGTDGQDDDTIIDESCSSDSDCGYKQICRGGSCESVECTTDSQCSGCRRCSGYSCVSCGSGPYGCYC